MLCKSVFFPIERKKESDLTSQKNQQWWMTDWGIENMIINFKKIPAKSDQQASINKRKQMLTATKYQQNIIMITTTVPLQQ